MKTHYIVAEKHVGTARGGTLAEHLSFGMVDEHPVFGPGDHLVAAPREQHSSAKKVYAPSLDYSDFGNPGELHRRRLTNGLSDGEFVGKTETSTAYVFLPINQFLDRKGFGGVAPGFLIAHGSGASGKVGMFVFKCVRHSMRHRRNVCVGVHAVWDPVCQESDLGKRDDETLCNASSPGHVEEWASQPDGDGPRGRLAGGPNFKKRIPRDTNPARVGRSASG